MSYADGRTQPPSQRRPYAPNPTGRANGYPRNIGPEITGLSANESTSQWSSDNSQSRYQGRKADNALNDSTRQQYAFPAPPNQPPAGASAFPSAPSASEYDPTPPQSTAPSRVASSRASTVSSVGTIPDFPLPQLPVPPMPVPTVAPQRKSQTIGPPSARRPGPTYLTRDSFVTPIAEESPEVSPRSVAFNGGAGSHRSTRLGAEVPSRNPLGEKGESGVQHISTRDDATRLIRQAGRDQKTKPELVITSPPTAPAVQQAAGSFRFPFASPTRSRSSSEYELEVEKPPVVFYGSRSRSPLLSPDEGTPSPLSEKNFEARPSMSDKRPPGRRPPRLDLDTVRETEARGSLTSLPDLIRRATKLAANLDRGRTASRLGMLDVFSSSEKLGRDRTDAQSMTGSISDMLSAFPVPGTTPTFDRFAPDHALAKKERKKSGRRCCGMSLGVFVVICVFLLVLIAAAVLVPVFLIIIPQQHQAQRDGTSRASLSDCSASLPCSNGGVSLISGNACSCICVNGFTGAQCTTGEDPGCTTNDITSGSKRISNATLGASIPRLLTGSQRNFSIPLNGTSLLSLFSANSLSCTSENALVTFNSQSAKSKRFYIVPEEEPIRAKSERHAPVPTARAEMVAPKIEKRNPQTVGTSAGIVFQQSTTATPTASQTVVSIASSTPSLTPGDESYVSEDTLDFARIAVLFIFEQTSNLHAAIQAQQSIGDLFLQSNTSSTLPLNFGGLNVTASFDSFALSFGNGTVLGGNGNGKGGLRGMGKKTRKKAREVT
jgi:hypothetical protein